MKTCAGERQRLVTNLAQKENVLGLYRQLWKTYRELAELSLPGIPTPAERRQQMRFIEETAVPIVKAEIEATRESLENVTRAQELGCMELANGN